MSESTKSPPAKRLRMTNEPEQVLCDVANPGNPPLGPSSDESPLPASRETEGFDINSFLLEFVQTDAGADDLANALKGQSIREVLKQRGFKVNVADDVGYNSLPLELRDQIREYVISDLTQDEYISNRFKCSPRLSTYACIDTEWQASIERVTFRSLYLDNTPEELDQDLTLFERHVVGNRRQYLQHISLPCTVQGIRVFYRQPEGGVCLPMIHRLFNCMKQWPEVAILDSGLHLELSNLNLPHPERVRPPLDIQYTDEMLSKLAELPVVPKFTGLSFEGPGLIRVEVLQLLLPCLPQLQHMSIQMHTLRILEQEFVTSSRNGTNRANRMQSFFTNLSRTVPGLKSLKVPTKMSYMDSSVIEYRSALMSYSQSLQELLLKDTSREAILDCFKPFRAENFDPHAPSLLYWPDLTNLDIEMFHVGDGDADYVGRVRELIMMVGRAIRCMPRIQNLQMELGFMSKAHEVEERYYNTLFLTLEVFWDDALNGSRAELSLSQDWFDYPETRLDPSNMAKAVASEEVRDLWRESLLKGANAVLEIYVAAENEPNENENA